VSEPRLVVDASAVIELLAGAAHAAKVADLLAGHEVLAPELLDAEALSGLKGLERGGRLTSARAGLAVSGLVRMPIRRWSLAALAPQAWELRHRLSAYDAFYAALARIAGAPVLTADRRWARTGDLGITVITVG
jgi:predicted nucleic acid-binding protein